MPDGREEYWSFISDQDELTQKEQALNEANRANMLLKQAETELRVARDAAEEASRVKTSFLFNMSHDIRTPMNAIVGYSELIEKHIDDKEKCMQYLSGMRLSSDFLLGLINDVLEMARIESGKVTLQETPCSTQFVPDQIHSVYSEEIRRKHITFIEKNEIHIPYVYADALKLGEVFLNLISNAIKYTPDGGYIEVHYVELPCDRDGFTTIRATISDNGIGMSMEFLPHLFEEFSRERAGAETKVQGTGLGMSIVKKYVELMDGTITVDSEIGRGTIFTITTTHRIAQDPAERVESARKPVGAHVSFKGRRILMAEDNDINAEIAMAILGELGITVDRASDGVQCIDLLRKSEFGYYDLILMDIQMPKLDGYQTTRKIRDAGVEIPVVAMTANALEDDVSAALEAGMNAHLSKPIEVQKLVDTLQMILDC